MSGSTASGVSHLHTSAASTLTIVSHPTQTGSVAATTLTVASHATHTGSFPANTLTHVSHPTAVASFPAITLAHGGVSVPSLSHQAIGTHVGTDYGVHTITQPAAHGTAGTLTHSFTEPDAHAVSAHDTVSMVPSFFALAYIQRMS